LPTQACLTHEPSASRRMPTVDSRAFVERSEAGIHCGVGHAAAPYAQVDPGSPGVPTRAFASCDVNGVDSSSIRRGGSLQSMWMVFERHTGVSTQA